MPFGPRPWRRVARGAALMPLRRATGPMLRAVLLLAAGLAATGAVALLGPWRLDDRLARSSTISGTRAEGAPTRSAVTPTEITTPQPGVTLAPSPTALATETPLATLAPPTATRVPPTPGPTVHVVSRGENLTTIARRYGSTVEAIVRANRLDEPDVIPEGMRLVIPR
jgi:LysM repeat protein